MNVYALLRGLGVPAAKAREALTDAEDYEGPGNPRGVTPTPRSGNGFAAFNSGTTPASDMPNPVGDPRQARGGDAVRQGAMQDDLGAEIPQQAAYTATAQALGSAVVKSYLQRDGKLHPAFIAKAVADILVEKGIAGASEIAWAMAEVMESALLKADDDDDDGDEEKDENGDKVTRKSKPRSTPVTLGLLKAETGTPGTPVISKAATIAKAIMLADDRGELSLAERIAAKRLLTGFNLAMAAGGDLTEWRQEVLRCPLSAARAPFEDLI